MMETDKHFIFPGKTIFRVMTQNYDGILWRKDLPDVKAARFNSDTIPIHNGHYNEDIGYIVNMTFTNDRWDADFYFDKSKMSESDQQDLATGKKRDVSIGFTCRDEATDFDEVGFHGYQRDITVNHISWEQKGRCPSPMCGLDSANHRYEVIDLTECDEIKQKLAEITARKEAADADITAIKLENTTLKTALDAYQVKEKADTIEAILKISSYDKADLEAETLEDLTKKLNTLGKAKVIPAFPVGDNETSIKVVTSLGVQDLSHLMKETK